MARRIPPDRFTELVRAATRVFIALGYRRAQMADVAQALGVAKGTLYGYVESKEALFLLCARHCDDPGPVAQPERLPVPTPARGETLRALVDRLEEEGRLPELGRALRRRRARDVRAELEAILRELWAAQRRNRFAIELIDRCGGDHPELSEALQRQVREGPQTRLARYLEARRRTRALREIPDAFLAARILLETLTTWAVHIEWDPVPQQFDAKRVEDAVLAFTMSGLLRDAHGPEGRS